VKVGDLVKHTPWKDEYIRMINNHSDFQQGLIINFSENSKGVHFLVSVPGRNLGWYRESELEVIDENRRLG